MPPPSPDQPSRRRWVPWLIVLAGVAFIAAVVIFAVLPRGEEPRGGLAIPDDELRALINAELGQPRDADISAGDAASLTSVGESSPELIAADIGIIESIEGLEHFTNLRTLVLEDNSPYFGSLDPLDLSPLAQLTELEKLSLNFSRVRDVAPLAGLERLHTLELVGNELTDPAPLAELTRLRNLNLLGNAITRLEWITPLKDLQRLDLSMNNVSDLSGIEALMNLEELNLSSNRIEDTGPLSDLRSLDDLDLTANLIVDAAPLAGLSTLEVLNLNENLIVDAAPLAPLLGIDRLKLSTQHVTGDLTPGDHPNPVRDSRGEVVPLEPGGTVRYDEEGHTMRVPRNTDAFNDLLRWETVLHGPGGQEHTFDGVIELRRDAA